MDRFVALSEPNRRRILEMLVKKEHAAGEIARAFALSPPAVSQHLKVLREAGLVQVRADGQRRIYALDPNGFEELGGWIDRMRAHWTVSLDRLAVELEADEEDRT